MQRLSEQTDSARPQKAPLASQYGAIGPAAVLAALLFSRKDTAPTHTARAA